jgi:signal transduction histidine kinase
LQKRPHEEFLELCAVSTSGNLTEEEQRTLREHLAVCCECRQALKEFEAVVDFGVPQLSSELSGLSTEQISSRPIEAPEVAALERVPSAVQADGANSAEEGPRKGLAFARRNGHRQTRVNWNFVWVPFAASIVLAIALGIYAYRIGRSRGVEIARVAPSSSEPRVDALEQQVSDDGHERAVLKAEVAQRDRMIAELRHQVEQQTAGLDEMKSVQLSLEQSIQSGEAENQQFAAERGNLAQKLDAAQASVQRMQTELDSLRQERAQAQTRSASLETRINDLSAQLRDREQAMGKQQELLAHDRDIRDLMGARDLYIAEVYDVAGDGKTKKPYGRLFYTKGKSLIFYAYDLDREAGVKNASTFQAWGRRGPDKQQALNLGIFYQDNVAKKRWVLKFDDPGMLDQIDAVFVTVEPNGGSHRPSSKPLLFAYLKIDPNHP